MVHVNNNKKKSYAKHKRRNEYTFPKDSLPIYISTETKRWSGEAQLISQGNAIVPIKKSPPHSNGGGGQTAIQHPTNLPPDTSKTNQHRGPSNNHSVIANLKTISVQGLFWVNWECQETRLISRYEDFITIIPGVMAPIIYLST